MKKNPLLLTSAILIGIYLLVLVIASLGLVGFLSFIGAVAVVILIPHIVLLVVAWIFNWVAWGCDIKWASVVSGILYILSIACAAIIFQIQLIPFVFIPAVLCFIAFATMPNSRNMSAMAAQNICPNCKTLCEANAQFCLKCGTKLEASASLGGQQVGGLEYPQSNSNAAMIIIAVAIILYIASAAVEVYIVKKAGDAIESYGNELQNGIIPNRLNDNTPSAMPEPPAQTDNVGETDGFFEDYKETDPEADSASNNFVSGSIKGTRVNMRAYPSTDADVVYQFPGHETVTILEATQAEAGKYSWYKVSYGSYEGWVYGQFIEINNY